MPTQFLKNLAEKHNMSLSKVEGLWDKAKKIVSKKYDESSKSYWPLVVSITKRMAGESKSSFFKLKNSISEFLKVSDVSNKDIIKDELNHVSLEIDLVQSNLNDILEYDSKVDDKELNEKIEVVKTNWDNFKKSVEDLKSFLKKE